MQDSALKKVLIIDDDTEFDQMLSEKIRLAGMEPVITLTGKEALQYLTDNNDVAFIILDFVMPEMDGAEFYRMLRHDMRRDIPTVVLTNLSNTQVGDDLEVFTKSDTNLDSFVEKIRQRLYNK